MTSSEAPAEVAPAELEIPAARKSAFWSNASGESLSVPPWRIIEAVIAARPVSPSASRNAPVRKVAWSFTSGRL